MCNQLKPEKFLRNYPVSFKRESWECIAPDVLFITKEKLQIPAHKVILAGRDQFWFTLFQNVKGCAGVCPAEPFYVFLPEFDYQTVLLVIQSYYQENVKVPKKKSEDFQCLSRNFDKCVIKSETTCRICKQKVNTQILHHVIEHVKNLARNDKQKAVQDYTQEIRCSFHGDKMCKLDDGRGVFANGMFNDRYCENTNDMIQAINQHYRRHLRAEIDNLRNEGIKVPGEDMETSFWHLAEISDYIATAENEDSVGAGERMPHASAGDRMPRFFPSTDRLEGEVNDYSISGICDEDEEEARPERVANAEQSPKSASNYQKTGTTDTHQSHHQCKQCSQTFKSDHGFRKHIIKELSSELEHFLVNGDKSNTLDKKSNMCKVQNCKDHGKSFANFGFLMQHVCTVHKLLEEYLKSKDESINDWDSASPNANKPSAEASTPKSKNLNNTPRSCGKKSRLESTWCFTRDEAVESSPQKRLKPATKSQSDEKAENQDEEGGDEKSDNDNEKSDNNDDKSDNNDNKSDNNDDKSDNNDDKSDNNDDKSDNDNEKSDNNDDKSNNNNDDKSDNNDDKSDNDDEKSDDDDDDMSTADDIWGTSWGDFIGKINKHQEKDNVKQDQSEQQELSNEGMDVDGNDGATGDNSKEGAGDENIEENDSLVDSESDKDTLPPMETKE